VTPSAVMTAGMTRVRRRSARTFTGGSLAADPGNRRRAVVLVLSAP
jgi:hypothetical protein